MTIFHKIHKAPMGLLSKCLHIFVETCFVIAARALASHTRHSSISLAMGTLSRGCLSTLSSKSSEKDASRNGIIALDIDASACHAPPTYPGPCLGIEAVEENRVAEIPMYRFFTLFEFLFACSVYYVYLLLLLILLAAWPANTKSTVL